MHSPSSTEKYNEDAFFNHDTLDFATRLIRIERFYCITTISIKFVNTSVFTCRLFHHPKLYKYIHKTHHEWTAPVGVASIYCHPLEHFVVNLGPVVAGPIVAGSHLAVAWFWFAMVVISTTINHSGYHFPFLPSSESHDFHHAKLVLVFIS